MATIRVLSGSMYNMFALLVLALASLCSSSFVPWRRPHSQLPELALQKVLAEAAPVFGVYQNVQSNTSTWMSKYLDSTLIVHLNMPGTHDADTWNYTQPTQDSLLGVTNLRDIFEVPPKYFRCQDLSIIDMLDMGIRVFDLRPALDVTNTSLVFWHSQALVSETATMDDVMYGFYQWLDDHPTEAVFLSFQYEGGTAPYATDNAQVDMMLYNTLSSPAARKYILQVHDEFGTLGQARGKITLLKRFDLGNLPPSYAAALPGVHFSPNNWTDNNANITLVYNTATDATAYIEDYYGLDSPFGSTAALNIQWKYNATTAHLNMAATTHPDSLFWTFASSEYDLNSPPETPMIMALGNGTQYTPLGGVNQRLVPFLQRYKGSRLGILMFDFFETPSDLVDTFLSLQQGTDP